MNDINTFVEEFQGLSLEDQEYVAELIKKQLVESRRQSLLRTHAPPRGSPKNNHPLAALRENALSVIR